MQNRVRSRLFWRRLAQLARPCWPHLTGITVLSLLATPLALLLPLPLKIAVDSVLGRQPFPAWLMRVLPAAAGATRVSALTVTAGLLVAISLLMSLQSLASWLLYTYYGRETSP